MHIIDQIKSELNSREISKAELARRMKGNTATRQKDLTEVLSGKREPGIGFLEEIAKALECKWTLKVDDQMNELQILKIALNQFYSQELDVEGEGNGIKEVAEASRLIRILNQITPNAHIYPDVIKIQVKAFINAYQAAQKGEPVYGNPIFKLINPTYNILKEYIINRIKEIESNK